MFYLLFYYIEFKVLVRQFGRKTYSLNIYKFKIYLIIKLKNWDRDSVLVIVELYIFLKLVDNQLYFIQYRLYLCSKLYDIFQF